MSAKILRQYGRDVPEWAQEYDSDEYILWCKMVFGIHDDECTVVHKHDSILGVTPDGILIVGAERGGDGIWRVQ